MCTPNTLKIPCGRLSYFLVAGVRRGTQEERFFQTIPATLSEGTRITFTPTPPDHAADMWTVYVYSVDVNGVSSCRSNPFGLNATLDVPDVPSVGGKDEWFDVQGRHYYTKPTTPGVYVHRRGPWKKFIVIL